MVLLHERQRRGRFGFRDILDHDWDIFLGRRWRPGGAGLNGITSANVVGANSNDSTIEENTSNGQTPITVAGGTVLGKLGGDGGAGGDGGNLSASLGNVNVGAGSAVSLGGGPAGNGGSGVAGSRGTGGEAEQTWSYGDDENGQAINGLGDAANGGAGTGGAGGNGDMAGDAGNVTLSMNSLPFKLGPTFT